MGLRKFITAFATFVATGAASAQPTPCAVPDAGFKSTLTRAEVRQEMAKAYSQRQMVQQQYTGQDPVYGNDQRSRAEVHLEAENIPLQGHIDGMMKR